MTWFLKIFDMDQTVMARCRVSGRKLVIECPIQIETGGDAQQP
jgi:hypothetical protein